MSLRLLPGNGCRNLNKTGVAICSAVLNNFEQKPAVQFVLVAVAWWRVSDWLTVEMICNVTKTKSTFAIFLTILCCLKMVQLGLLHY